MKTAAELAYIAYTGKSAPSYGANDSATMWATLPYQYKSIWERVAKAVLDGEAARASDDEDSPVSP